ncbi:hypothetical protein [Candidatus Amarobacter glycogenicus]|uniref:hypothetical protein n=1 Tax=Candidatus Amarobacter glycogenicus TaxID=3140699 RepID=UPI002A0E7FA8|nr:hypothetical protein [Dehalococcoidia bacterium]
MAHCSLTMSFDAMLPGFAETELHRPSGGFTMMTFGVGAGAPCRDVPARDLHRKQTWRAAPVDRPGERSFADDDVDEHVDGAGRS